MDSGSTALDIISMMDKIRKGIIDLELVSSGPSPKIQGPDAKCKWGFKILKIHVTNIIDANVVCR
jgi:hypothetical protein